MKIYRGFMLRVFGNLYTIRNVFYIFTEGVFIYSAVIISSRILLGDVMSFLDIWLHLKALMISLVCIICLYYNSVYDMTLTKKYSELSIRLLQAFGASLIFLSGIYAVFQDMIICDGFFLLYLPIVMCLISFGRFLYLLLLNSSLYNEKVIMVGSGQVADSIIQTIEEEIDCGYNLVARVEKNNPEKQSEKDQSNVLNIQGFDNLYATAKDTGAKKIIVAIQEKRGAFPLKELLKCRVGGIEIVDGISFYEMLKGKLIVAHTSVTWLIFSEGFKKSLLHSIFKRIEDIIIALILLIVLTPVIILTAIFIRLESAGPIIYSQERLGKRKKPYMVHKFRSMSSDAEKESGPVWAQQNDTRITRVGHFIRKWRVDEIPQLWNVFKGEMSMIGPRPERDYFVKQLEDIIPYYSERHSIKPGLTGWAQVCYGYGDSVDDAIEKLNYELFYIKNMSVFLDVVIVFRTVKTVLFGVGAR